MDYDDRRRYRRLKLLTTIGPTLFVAVAETVRFYYLRRILPPASVSLVAVAVTLVGAAGFSSYVFDVIEKWKMNVVSIKMLCLRFKNESV